MGLEDIYNMIPLNARLFLDSLQGVTTPVTEKDLKPEELKVLEDIYRSRQRTYDNSVKFANANPRYSAQDRIESERLADKIRTDKQVGYGEYAPHVDERGWMGALVDSIKDPRFRMGTSLGNFGMQQQGNNLNFYDTYNWNGDYHKPIKSLADLFQMTDFSHPTDILNGLAELYAPKVNRPVNINIPVPQR